LDSLKKQIEIDSIKFERAVKLYSEDKMTSESGGVILSDETGSNLLPLDVSMEPNLYFTVDPMKVGAVSSPMNYRSPDGKTGMRIVKVKTRKEAHKASLKDDYEKLKSFALNMKQNEIIEKWFKEALSEVFISVDPEYQSCRIFEQ
jgi:peptidyl-prolyl cis-trans isomerase SurA